MYFSFYSKDINFVGNLFYLNDEYSLQYRPYCTNVGTTIVYGTYTGLDIICETCEVVYISGFSPKNAWVRKRMTVPKAKTGRLWVHLSNPPLKGVGISYGDYWETYYDDEKQYICIGDNETNESDDCVEFANNVIGVLRDGDLIAIWAKIKEVETAKDIEKELI